MSVQVTPQSWEVLLLDRAHQPLAGHQLIKGVIADNNALDRAFQHCEQITKDHSRTFYLASSLLPLGKREAVRALYAFCRVTDNIVDQPSSENPQAALDHWQHLITQPQPPANDLVALAWAVAQLRFKIPSGYAQQLIDGCRRDFYQTRYATFAELAEYAYGVASTVGLMAMHVIGYTHPDAIQYAVKLGVALQVTNILRDVREDWLNGRVYLPQEDLARFGLSEADLEAGVVTDNWRAFMAFQIARVHALYADSLPGLRYLNGDGRFAIAAAARLYEGILDEIEARDYDVFGGRVSISTLGKIGRLPAIWWQSVTAGV